MGFSKFGLSEDLLEGIREAGYTVPTPIQKLAIGPALAGRDLIGRAETGTGKTAAFVLPLLHRLSADRAQSADPGRPRALVLTPTRELAQQVHLAVEKYGKRLPLRSMSIYGGVGFDAQEKLLRRGVDIVIATPGRLLDHMQRRSVNLSGVEYLVLDEADRMLDMGFIKDVRSIIDRLPRKRQTLLFSATMPESITELAAEILHNPETVEAEERQGPAPSITEEFYQVSREAKLSFLLALLEQEHLESVLVFSRTKHGADKICRRLDRSGVAATAIHSNRTQSQRERALQAFKNGNARVLVATDIAARGIDVTGISHVINYDVPRYAEDYVHRIGRTGRAGATGHAITFVGTDEEQYVRRIEQFTGKRVPTRPLPAGLDLAPQAPPAEGRVHRAPASGQDHGRERRAGRSVSAASHHGREKHAAASASHTPRKSPKDRHTGGAVRAEHPQRVHGNRDHASRSDRHNNEHRQTKESHRGGQVRRGKSSQAETSWSNYRRPARRRFGSSGRHR